MAAIIEASYKAHARRLIFFALTLSGGCLMVVLYYLLPDAEFSVASPAMQTYGFSLIAITFVGIVGLVVDRKKPTFAASFLAWPPISYLGSASYSIYLWHLPAYMLIQGRIEPAADFMGAIRWYAIALSITVGISLVAYHLFELPIERLRKHLRRKFGTKLIDSQRVNTSVDALAKTSRQYHAKS